MKKPMLVRDLIKRIKKEKPVKVEETLACEHKTLTKLAGIWYQCNECKQIFYFFGSACYKKEMLEEEIKEIIKLAK